MTLIGKHQKQHQPEEAKGARKNAFDGTSPKDEDGGKDDSGPGTAAREEVIQVCADAMRVRLQTPQAAFSCHGPTRQ